MDSVGFSLLALNPLPFRLSAASASSEARCAALFFGCPGAFLFATKERLLLRTERSTDGLRAHKSKLVSLF